MKKALFIGGTGTISGACTRRALEAGFEVTLLNRGSSPAPRGARQIVCDISDEAAVRAKLTGEAAWFDVVADFIAFRPEQAERDVRLFSGAAGQYIFISSASVYQKPAAYYLITESTPLSNPYWQYARDKIACELTLMEAYRGSGFPVTIVRPSHTYNETKVPVAIHGKAGSWQVLRRILDGKPVLVPGDGLTWWTFTWSADFAAGFVGLMGNPHALGEAVHITSDEKLTWNAAYQTLGRALGREPLLAHVSVDTLKRFDPALEGPLLGDKANSVIFDNSKLKRLVPGFAATTRYDEGARAAVEYLLAHEALQNPDPEFDAFCDRVVSAVL
ncbi:MAG: SDR family oxidoreductase [Clostridiales bacterium]|jgi:nucleoside-diphosphate-sugar epimerase|nr:SDR family oxidoreductase [Clostridiales bacterium]